jgi:hypothetical protein
MSNVLAAHLRRNSVKLSHIVSAFALAALALTAPGVSAQGASQVESLKITIAADGKDCATKGGTLITNKNGSKTCSMPASCEPHQVGDYRDHWVLYREGPQRWFDEDGRAR